MTSPFALHDDPARLRTDLRRRFAEVAARLASGRPLEAADHHLASVLADHPEDCRRLAGRHADDLVQGTGPHDVADGPFFLHLALHVALREQAAADLPPGIRTLHASYVSWAGGDRVRAEHRMLPILEEAMRRSLGRPGGDDPRIYLEALAAELERLNRRGRR